MQAYSHLPSGIEYGIPVSTPIVQTHHDHQPELNLLGEHRVQQQYWDTHTSCGQCFKNFATAITAVRLQVLQNTHTLLLFACQEMLVNSLQVTNICSLGFFDEELLDGQPICLVTSLPSGREFRHFITISY